MLIDDVMSGVANIVCGVPQGSVLDPLKFCLYLLPLGAILKYNVIGYHIHADDTELYISFKCNNPLSSLHKLNNCISDIRVWMIKNKLKISDSKTDITRNEIDLTGNETDITRNETALTHNEIDITRDKIDLTGNETDITRNETDLIRN